MQIHHLTAHSSSRTSRRIGRGGKRGTYSGKGIKGQKSRAGAKMRPAEREILKKIPKLRGYRFKSFRAQPAALNLFAIEKAFQSGETVSPETLLAKGLIRRIAGKTPRVKILGQGGGAKSFVFHDVAFSASARLKANQ